VKKYGLTDEEKNLNNMIVCRDIVKTIVDFGVNEIQKIQIIKLLSLEMENRELSVSIAKLCNDYLQDKKSNENINRLIET